MVWDAQYFEDISTKDQDIYIFFFIKNKQLVLILHSNDVKKIMFALKMDEKSFLGAEMKLFTKYFVVENKYC